MASVKEIIDKVIFTTRRYDRAEFAESRVKMAIKSIHAADQFDADRVELIIPFADLTLTAGDTIGQFQIPAFFRVFETIRPQDSAGNPVGKKLDAVSPREIEKRLASPNFDDVDTYYVAGTNVNFKAKQEVYQMLVSYYQFPDLTFTDPETLDDVTTWVTDLWEEAVHDLACYYMYSMIGNREIAATFKNTYDREHKPDILRSHSQTYAVR